jgi:hypothetical protein
MLKTLSPAIKGLITGLLMLAVALTLFYTNQPGDSGLQYIAYAIYAGGIVWALIGYRQSPSFTGKFGDLFGQGFRCFIVVTLLMVAFTGIFSKMHPEFAEDQAKAYKEYLIKEKKKLPAEIETEVATFKKQYTMRLVSASIFGYLIIGSVITAGCSAFLIRRNQ